MTIRFGRLGLHATQFLILQALELAVKVGSRSAPAPTAGNAGCSLGLLENVSFSEQCPSGNGCKSKCGTSWVTHDARWRDLQKLSTAVVDIVANSRMEGVSNDN